MGTAICSIKEETGEIKIGSRMICSEEMTIMKDLLSREMITKLQG